MTYDDSAGRLTTNTSGENPSVTDMTYTFSTSADTEECGNRVTGGGTDLPSNPKNLGGGLSQGAVPAADTMGTNITTNAAAFQVSWPECGVATGSGASMTVTIKMSLVVEHCDNPCLYEFSVTIHFSSDGSFSSMA